MYDPSCEELAREFLPDGTREEVVAALAQEIQDAVESFLTASVARPRGEEKP